MEMRKELLNPKLHSYVLVYVLSNLENLSLEANIYLYRTTVYGQKPEE